MTEIRLWRWEYSDSNGRRKQTKWLMTEHEAIRYKDAVRLQHTLRVIYDQGRLDGPRLLSETRAHSLPRRSNIGPRSPCN